MTVEAKHPILQTLGLPDGSPSDATATTKAKLDLLLLGLECLSGESSEAVLGAAQTLQLDSWISDRVNLWRLRNANPLRRSTGGRKRIDVDEARALVLIICHLATQHHAQLRITIEHLEQAVLAERSPFQEPKVGDYLDEFHSHYRSRMVDGDQRGAHSITELGLRVLVDLLFYSSKQGPHRLWQALLQRPEMDGLPDIPDSPEAEQPEAELLQPETDS